jgi:large subunit ribosomal protein L20
MVRVTNSVAARRRTKRLLKKCKGFYGDRKNHLRLSKDALMSAMAFNYEHRKLRKRDFRSLWIVRIGVAAKLCGISYSKMIHGLQKGGCLLNRKSLADLAVRDMDAFRQVVDQAKAALVH